jgi:selenium metabolism protein YedF
MQKLDVRTVACPGPVLALKKALEEGATTVTLLVGDELARSNVTRFATSRGARAAAEALPEGGFTVTVEAAASTLGAVRALADEEVDCEVPAPDPAGAPANGPTVVQITAATMGSGDDELGALLMRSFLKTHLQLEGRPDTLLFYNGAVRLCCAGSVLLDDLRALSAAGVEILACGTCLNYFGLADELAVGRVTDMLEIVTRLHEAGRVVRP